MLGLEARVNVYNYIVAIEHISEVVKTNKKFTEQNIFQYRQVRIQIVG